MTAATVAPLRPVVSLLVVGVVLGLLAPAASAQVERGPYLQNLKKTVVDVVWEGQPFTATPRVGYGSVTPDEQFTDAVCFDTHCWAKVGGLEPGTAYVYAVYDGEDKVSPEGAIHTAADGTVPFKFAVYGDNRSDHDAHELVIQSLVDDFSFIVHTGDMVSDGEIEEHWDFFFDIEADVLRNAPVYGAIGNHEEHDGEAPIYARLFHFPSSESGSPSEFYYSFTYSNSHFVFIDGWVDVMEWYFCILVGKAHDNCLTPEQLEWVEDDLKAARNDPAIDNVFVVMHEGPYSSKPGRTGSAAIRDLMGEFGKSKVKLIISGHDHYYEHGISGNGIPYMISGGGGAPLYETAPDVFAPLLWPHEVHESTSVHNYQVVSVNGEHIEVVSYDVDQGGILTEYEIGEPPSCLQPGDCIGELQGPCDGDWTCPDFDCVWECAPPPACETVDDCPPAPQGGCPGHWECPFTQECHWACDALPAECAVDADCAGKDPLNACEGGHYECESQEGVCEWACEGPVPADPGGDDADAALSPETDAGGPAEGQDTADTPVGMDAGSGPTPSEDGTSGATGETTGDPTDEDGGTAPAGDPDTDDPTEPGSNTVGGPTVTVSTESDGGPHETGGCSGAAPGPLSPLWLALLALALRRRSHLRCV